MQSETSELHAELRHCDQLRRAESTLATRLAESRRSGDHMETQAMKAPAGGSCPGAASCQWQGEVGWGCVAAGAALPGALFIFLSCVLMLCLLFLYWRNQLVPGNLISSFKTPKRASIQFYRSSSWWLLMIVNSQLWWIISLERPNLVSSQRRWKIHPPTNHYPITNHYPTISRTINPHASHYLRFPWVTTQPWSHDPNHLG